MSVASIARERALLAGVGLIVRFRENWRARFNYTTDRAVTSPASAGFVHIAVVSDPGDLIGTEDAVMQNVENIGISRFPATGISYNFAVFNTGRIYEGQPLTRRGAHTYNDFNRAICSTNGCPGRGTNLKLAGSGSDGRNLNYSTRAVVLPQQVTDVVTDIQVHGIARCFAAMQLSGQMVKGCPLHGHRCVAGKDCPGGRAWARMSDIRDLTSDYVRKGLGGAIDMSLDAADLKNVSSIVWGLGGQNFVEFPNGEKVPMGQIMAQLSTVNAAQIVLLNRILTEQNLDANEVKALANELAPLLQSQLIELGDEQLNAIARAAADEQDRRIRERLGS